MSGLVSVFVASETLYSSGNLYGATASGEVEMLFDPGGDLRAMGGFVEIGTALWFSYSYDDDAAATGVSSKVMRLKASGRVEEVATLEGVEVVLDRDRSPTFPDLTLWEEPAAVAFDGA